MAGPRARDDAGGELTTDRELVVRSWDGWLEAVTGIASESACGTPLRELAPRAGEPALQALMRRVIDEGRVEVLAPALHGYLISCPPRRPTAEFPRMQQRITLTPLRAGDEVLGLLARVEDVTERRAQERELARRLRSGDERERLEAAEALAAAEAPAAVLTAGFADVSWKVRKASAAGASEDPTDEAADILVRLVREQHRDLAVLNAALTAIAGSGARVLPRLLPLLRAADEDQRIYAALVLGQLGDPAAVESLLEVVADPSPNVAFHAIEALGRLAAREAALRLTGIAEDRDFFLASAAIEALGLVGDASLAHRLLPLLGDDLLRPAVLDALARCGAEDVVAPLLGWMSHADAEVERVAATIAAIHDRLEEEGPGGGAVAATVRANVTGPAAAALMAAARTEPVLSLLGWLDRDEAAAPLIAGLSEPETRPVAAAGLARRGDADALLAALDGLAGDALSEALVVLGRIGNERAVPALLAIAEGAESDLAILAVAALGGIGSPAAFDRLMALLDRPDGALRQAVIGAVSSIGDPRMAERVRAALASTSPLARESAVRLAGYFGYEDCLDAMLALAADDQVMVRRAVAEHICAYDDPRVAGCVARLAGDDNAVVRASAVRAVPVMGGAPAVRIVAGAVRDRDLWVRYYGARSAQAIGDASLADALAALARADDVPPVRIAAVEALAAVSGHSAAGVLEALCEDPDDGVAAAALAGLARIDPDHPQVAAALASGDRLLQRSVLQAMACGAPGAAVTDQVVRVLRDAADAGVRGDAASWLAAGPPDGVLRLCELAIGPRLRADCLEALVAAAASRLAELSRAAADPRAPVRDMALEALARCALPGAGSAIAKALADSDPDLARRAAHGLLLTDLRAAAGGGTR